MEHIVLYLARNLGANVVCVGQLAGLIPDQVFRNLGSFIVLRLVGEISLSKASDEISSREAVPPGFGRIRVAIALLGQGLLGLYIACKNRIALK